MNSDFGSARQTPGGVYVPTNYGQRRLGRKLFLGALGAGTVGVASGSLLSAPLRAVRSVALPASGFTIYTVAPIPTFQPSTWRLSVGGMVTHPVSLSYAELLNQPMLSVTRDYQCVTGWKVPHCLWQGVSLTTLAALAGARSQARYINFYSSDGVYSESLRVANQAYRPDVLLAYNLNHLPLAAEQGLPLRLVVPEMYGYKYAKWVNRIEFSDRQEVGYWERNGYTIDAYLGTE